MATIKKISSEYISSHQYFTAKRDAYKTNTGKIVDPYFVVELPPCVAALAITEEGKVIMIKQYRYPINEVCLEIPGGFIDKNETAEKAIARELLEETGYIFSAFFYLGKTFANPGVLNNCTHLFLATGGKKVASQSLDANEEIEILLYNIDEVKQFITEGLIKQALHELCIYKAFQQLQVLNNNNE